MPPDVAVVEAPCRYVLPYQGMRVVVRGTAVTLPTDVPAGGVEAGEVLDRHLVVTRVLEGRVRR